MLRKWHEKNGQAGEGFARPFVISFDWIARFRAAHFEYAQSPNIGMSPCSTRVCCALLDKEFT
jgi:hypothetical protein